MNTSEVLDQFILEARDCLDAVGQRLLDIERNPQDTTLLNDLFRTVHTLKGNCGLFEFTALERVVHAGEDLLEQVRSGQVQYSGEIADALLAAMDLSGELIDAIATHGQLGPAHDAPALAAASALRRLIPAGPGAAAASAASAALPATASALPDWVQALPGSWQAPGLCLIRYQPEPTCFFKGEDPLALARQTPGLRRLRLLTPADWGRPESFDCYDCRLGFLILSDADDAALDHHFRYVPEQCDRFRPPRPAGVDAAARPPGDETPSDPAPAALARLRRRQQQLWTEQLSLLERHPGGSSSAQAARQVLDRLLAGLEPWLPAPERTAVAAQRAALAALPLSGSAVIDWARQAADSALTATPVDGPTPATSTSSATAGRPADRDPHADDDSSTGAERQGARSLRVAQDKIDRLVDLIGEMVVAKNALPYLAQRAEQHFGQRELAREIKNQYAVINRIAEDMQHAIMQVRMMPVGTVFQRFGRLVRDLSRRLGKEVELRVEGEDTEADKNVIESLADPLIHVLRNSLDHGLETPAVRIAAGKPATGCLQVRARQEGDRVLLDIEDDGAGIDPDRVRRKAVERGLIPADRAHALSDADAVQLVFLPGFSTAEQVSDLSGRGVGLDVVRAAVERVNGSVSLRSQRGRGTQIQLSLPLSMAITHVMMIRAGGCRFGVPMDLVLETVRVAADEIHHFKQAMTTVLRGRIVPLRALHSLLALEEEPRRNAEGEHAVLVLRLGQEAIGLIVDEFEGTNDIILRPLEGVLGGLRGFAGSALMGDGSVLMVLNPKEML